MAEPLLRVERVFKRFGGLLAVDNASLAVEAGRITALIGPNGAGKTTLFSIVSGFLPPSEGRIFHRGADITGMPPHLVARRGIVRTFQIVQPFAGLTVHENIAIGAHLSRRSRADALDAAAEVARTVGLGDLLGRPAASLTVAGRKRLEVARALAAEPKLLLLDEVLAGLNPPEVAAGEIVAVLGSNGAGKSTLIRTISGVLRATHGSIRFADSAIERERPATIVARGLIHVPEGRCVFPNLTIMENLDLGSYRRGRVRRESNRERVFAIFPRLAARRSQRAGTLSGGEQQMLAIGRALMAEPKLLILDEPSLGLSPLLVEELFALIRRINGEGIALLLVEQNVVQCLELARRAYILDEGMFVLQGNSADIRNDPNLKRAYLGL